MVADCISCWRVGLFLPRRAMDFFSLSIRPLWLPEAPPPLSEPPATLLPSVLAWRPSSESTNIPLENSPIQLLIGFFAQLLSNLDR